MNKAVIVVGMHRSGSSATMGVLRCLGVDIGDDLGGKNIFNEKGYLENQEFYRFEKKILRNSGADWKTIIPEIKIYKTFSFYEKEFELLIKKYNRSKYWGYKAIRGGLFPKTLKKIPNLHLIIILRSPEAVSKSLKRRNNFTKEFSLWLWSNYYFRILRFLSRNPYPFLIINYDDMVENTREICLKISKFLGFKPSKEQLKCAEEFIENRLRHF